MLHKNAFSMIIRTPLQEAK